MSRDQDDVDHDAKLGGRLALIPAERLDPDQQRLHERLVATRVARARDAGYTAALPDGRLIGPFNGFLRNPAIGERQLDWAQAISAADLPADVRETVILTVVAHWSADYATYAHVRAARKAGIDEEDIAELAAGRTPSGLAPGAMVAHRFTLALLREHHVPDDVYELALVEFGESRLVVIVTLIGQYLATSALLKAFCVPAPVPPAGSSLP